MLRLTRLAVLLVLGCVLPAHAQMLGVPSISTTSTGIVSATYGYFRFISATSGLSGGGGADVQTFTSSGTWTKPATGNLVRIECWGGGGGGGRSSTNGFASGGGGGGYLARWIPASSLGSTETVTIGAGGAGYTGVSPDWGNGSAGGTTTFGSHVTVYGGGGGSHTTGVTGGRGNPWAAGGTQTTCTSAVVTGDGVFGGAGSCSDGYVDYAAGRSFRGGGGGGRGSTSNATIRAGGASALGGAGGAGSASSGGAAGVGTQPGGGGGGGYNAAGATGGAGMCRATTF